MGIIHEINNILPRSALLTIYRSIIRPHLDYGDVIYDQQRMNCSVVRLNQFNTMRLWP